MTTLCDLCSPKYWKLFHDYEDLQKALKAVKERLIQFRAHLQVQVAKILHDQRIEIAMSLDAIKIKEEAIRKKDEEIADLNRQTQNWLHLVKVKDEVIQRKDIQIAQLQQQLQDLERNADTIKVKDEMILKKVIQIAKLQQQLLNQQKRNADAMKIKDEFVRDKDIQIANLQQQLDTEKRRDQIQPFSSKAESWMVPRAEVWKIPRKQIGFGAWGAVYSAKFRGEDVALKIAHQEIFHESTVDMIKREVTIMSHIQHPNLVRFIAAVWDDAVERKEDTPIIISELMDTNLRAAYRSVDLSNSLTSIFCDVAYALHYLHQHCQPIIHRDISAPNVLLKSSSGSYRAKVSDFGSANLVKQSKTAGAGAIVYCAPEMFPNEDISVLPQPQTTKVDVFSYGILLLEVLSKEMPAQETRYAMLQKIRRQWNEMYELIVHCTKPSPSDRPTMANILNKLNGFPH